MGSIVDLSKGADLPGCINAPLFMMELSRCLSEDVKKPACDMVAIFTELAQYAAEKDDPALNILMLRLGLFKVPPDKLKEALGKEAARLRIEKEGEKEISGIETLRDALIDAKGWLIKCLDGDNCPTEDDIRHAIDGIEAIISGNGNS